MAFRKITGPKLKRIRLETIDNSSVSKKLDYPHYKKIENQQLHSKVLGSLCTKYLNN